MIASPRRVVRMRRTLVHAVLWAACVPLAASGQARNVPNWSVTTSGARVIGVGHVDITSVMQGGALRTLIRDESPEGVANAPDGLATWHAPTHVVLHVRPDAALTIPDSRWRFIAPEGSRVWNIDQGGREGVIWPGWSAQTIPAAMLADGALTWTLSDVRGPGTVAVWQTDQWGNAVRIFDSKNGLPDSTRIPGGDHVHANWTFTAPGVYCLDFKRAATLAAGPRVTDAFTLAVAVDIDPRSVDPARCGVALSPGVPAPSPNSPATPPPTETAASPSGAAPGAPVRSAPSAPAIPAPRDGGSAPAAVTAPTIRARRVASPVDRLRRAHAGDLVCPVGTASCRVVAPKRVGVRIDGRLHWVSVISPRTVRSGRTHPLHVYLLPPAVRALRGRGAVAHIKLKMHQRDTQRERIVRVVLTGRPTATSVGSSRLKGSSVAIATLTCPVGPRSCRVTRSRRVPIVIGGRRFTVPVQGPSSVRPGRHSRVTVRLPTAVRRAVRGHRAVISVPIRVSDGTATAARRVRTIIDARSRTSASLAR